MKQLSLSGSLRENVGKKGAALERKAGKVPAVLYGGKEQLVFSLEENDAKKLVFTPEVYKIELDLEGKKTKAVVKEVQIHPISDDILHMDFMEIVEGKAVKIKLPVRITGSSAGVLAGGKLSQIYRTVLVSGKESDLPEAVTLDITDLKIGDKIRVSDINIEGVKMHDAGTSVVVAIRSARGATLAEEEEEAAEAAEGAEGEGEAAAE